MGRPDRARRLAVAPRMARFSGCLAAVVLQPPPGRGGAARAGLRFPDGSPLAAIWPGASLAPRPATISPKSRADTVEPPSRCWHAAGLDRLPKADTPHCGRDPCGLDPASRPCRSGPPRPRDAHAQSTVPAGPVRDRARDGGEQRPALPSGPGELVGVLRGRRRHYCDASGAGRGASWTEWPEYPIE